MGPKRRRGETDRPQGTLRLHHKRNRAAFTKAGCLSLAGWLQRNSGNVQARKGSRASAQHPGPPGHEPEAAAQAQQARPAGTAASASAPACAAAGWNFARRPAVSRLNPHVRQSAFSPSLPSPPPQPQPQQHHLNSFNFTTPAPSPSSSTTPNASDESLPRDAIVAVLSLPPWRSRPAPPRLWLDRPRASASDNETECLRDAALPTPAAHWQPRETWETCHAGGRRSRRR